MGDYNVTVADFAGKNRICMTDTLYQYDYGQKLQIDNIPALPQTYEAHFSNVQHGGVSITVTGMDGIVDIPNALLMTGKRIYCWIYVTEPGSGETEYQVLMPVQARPMPEYYDVTDTGAFDSVVQQVGEYAATATAGATSATASAAAAATSASEAAASASAAETAKTAAETAQGKAEDAQAAAETAAQTATEKAQQTAQDAAQAALDAGRAESAAQSAEAAQTGAESAKTDAETAAQDAAASASVASTSATSAGQAATSAAQSATAAAGSATTAQGAAQTATTKAGEASASATAAAASETAAETAQAAAEAAKDTAVANATTATEKAAEAAQSASGAAQSKTDAEAAATRAEQAAASLTVDAELSDTSANPVQNKVITGAVAQVKSALEQAENGISNGLGVAVMPSAPLYGKTITLDYTKIPTEVGYINTVGVPTGTTHRHFKLPMYGIKQITITPRQTLTNLFNYAYYWKNSEEILSIAISGTVTQTTSYTLTEPTDGYFLINYFTGGQYTSEIEIEFFNEKTANKGIKSLTTSVDSLVNLEFLKKPFLFSGKIATFFGDSIVYGVASPNFQYIGDNCFCKKFGSYVGMSVRNQGVSGSCICDNANDSITNKILNYSQSADFIFVAGGVNDYQTGKPIGAYGDTDITTFYGALHLICEKLTADYPDTTVIFITPINVNGYRVFSDAVYSINDYRRAIFETACSYGYNVVDGSKIGFPTGTGGFATALMADGIHPTEFGHDFYAKALCGKLL